MKQNRKDRTTMVTRALMATLDQVEQRGFEKGVEYMEQRILEACENGTPVEIGGKAFFVRDEISNLRDIFDDLEADSD